MLYKKIKIKKEYINLPYTHCTLQNHPKVQLKTVKDKCNLPPNNLLIITFLAHTWH